MSNSLNLNNASSSGAIHLFVLNFVILVEPYFQNLRKGKPLVHPGSIVQIYFPNHSKSYSTQVVP